MAAASGSAPAPVARGAAVCVRRDSADQGAGRKRPARALCASPCLLCALHSKHALEHREACRGRSAAAAAAAGAGTGAGTAGCATPPCAPPAGQARMCAAAGIAAQRVVGAEPEAHANGARLNCGDSCSMQLLAHAALGGVTRHAPPMRSRARGSMRGAAAYRRCCRRVHTAATASTMHCCVGRGHICGACMAANLPRSSLRGLHLLRGSELVNFVEGLVIRGMPGMRRLFGLRVTLLGRGGASSGRRGCTYGAIHTPSRRPCKR
eukprot:362796-Chlamydomonas_euryale.AAC.1